MCYATPANIVAGFIRVSGALKFGQLFPSTSETSGFRRMPIPTLCSACIIFSSAHYDRRARAQPSRTTILMNQAIWRTYDLRMHGVDRFCAFSEMSHQPLNRECSRAPALSLQAWHTDAHIRRASGCWPQRTSEIRGKRNPHIPIRRRTMQSYGTHMWPFFAKTGLSPKN